MWVLNPSVNRAAAAAFFAGDELQAVRDYYTRLAVAPTPLRSLPAVAAALGIAELLVKDETNRCGLPAFKILGAQFAIAQLRQSRGSSLTDVACATAGNHGRAVAHAARRLGIAAHVYVPLATPRRRIDAIRACGAHVVLASVEYDETVRLAAADARDHGWTVISDTGWPGYDAIPRMIMAGYTWMFEEADRQWHTPPDVVVVQAGVGGLAAAAAAWFAAHAPGTQVIVAEPAGSACVQASLRAGTRVTLDECRPTAMTCLRCGEVSTAAWPALRDGACAAIGVDDELTEAAMTRLADASSRGGAVLAGPSGACGLAGLMAVLQTDEARGALGLDRGTRALVVATEKR